MHYIKYIGLRVHWPEEEKFWSLHVSDIKEHERSFYIFPKGFFFPLPAESNLIKLVFLFLKKKNNLRL